jgi:hypothetical protein
MLSNLEQQVFDISSSHLQFDEDLLKMRDKFSSDKLATFDRLGLLTQLTDFATMLSPETVETSVDPPQGKIE